VENTMGFTPLQGLVMNTRSGDIDPAIPFYLMSHENKTAQEVNNLLNKKSGLLGISGFSGDMRDIIKHVKSRPEAKMAFHMYTSRVMEYISAYSLILKKTDLIIFTDTLGQKIPEIREAICSNLKCWGLLLDKEKNSRYRDGIADISAPGSRVKIMVIPTNEELMIARECHQNMEGASA
jgi:acetate kinase